MSLPLNVELAALFATVLALVKLDLLTASILNFPIEGQLEFVPDRDRPLNGFCIWFELELPQVSSWPRVPTARRLSRHKLTYLFRNYRCEPVSGW